MSKVSLAIIMFAALVNGVPSKAALFPTKALSDLAEDDLTGSGFERDSEARSIAGAEREESLEAKVVRQWREIAKRARRQAERHAPRSRGGIRDARDAARKRQQIAWTDAQGRAEGRMSQPGRGIIGPAQG